MIKKWKLVTRCGQSRFTRQRPDSLNLFQSAGTFMMFLTALQVRSLVKGRSRHLGDGAAQGVIEGYSVPVQGGSASLIYGHQSFGVGVSSLDFRILCRGQVTLTQNDVIEGGRSDRQLLLLRVERLLRQDHRLMCSLFLRLSLHQPDHRLPNGDFSLVAQRLQAARAVTIQLPCKPADAYWPKTFPVGSRLLAVYWVDICSFRKFICAVFRSGRLR